MERSAPVAKKEVVKEFEIVKNYINYIHVTSKIQSELTLRHKWYSNLAYEKVGM